ncbi:MAG: hypothetical protein LH649_13270 [Pseudanabaena sp. CAN_BIN31]|nr:hypothetical protein [Pseudanabaena sp. CAN_BIN31]
MESIKVRQHIGQDGILHLNIPVGLVEREVEVMVIYQPVRSYGVVQEKVLTPVWKSLESFYGICADDLIAIDDLGISESLDDELVGAFD